ncbi:MAG: hypothetical protein K2Q06_05410, partial [Parvularculaceae bacterium]|nr:hypothetical protein [Parvularculaceae bacterium]
MATGRFMRARRGGVGGFLLVVLLLAAAVAAAGYWAWREVAGPGPLKQETVFLLESGSSVADIATEL